MTTKKGSFLSLLRPYKSKALSAFICILIANLLGLAFPWAMKIIIDDVLINKDLLLLNILTAALIAAFVLKAYFGYMREYLSSVIGERVVCDLRNRILLHLQRLSVRYVEDTPTGKIISGVIGDAESIREFLFGGALDFIYSFFNVAFVLVILFLMDARLTLLSLVCLPVFGITFLKFSPRLKEKHRIVRDKYAELTAGLNEVFNGIRVVAGFAKGEYEVNRFNLKQKEIYKASIQSHRLGILLWIGSEFITSLGLITLVWFGARGVFAGRITAGELVAFYSYLGMLFFPVVKMVVINDYYQQASASLDRINGMLTQEPKVKEAHNPILLEKLKGGVRFEGVGFGYDEKKRVLFDINLKVGASEVIAFAGKSGAGKTTLINLLLRFYDPQEGAIFIDGHNLKDLGLDSYRTKIAMVLQDDYLFSASVKENILYGSPNACEDEVIEAARSANADDFIRELPDGYGAQIGERGIKLSYGQRQRISIARAVLRNPSILILDEATSNIDSETERIIVDGAFRNLMRGRTTFIIAHRLSTITYSDRIVFIDKGRITEAGSHMELLAKRGDYWRMWQEQVHGHRLESEIAYEAMTS